MTDKQKKEEKEQSKTENLNEEKTEEPEKSIDTKKEIPEKQPTKKTETEEIKTEEPKDGEKLEEQKIEQPTEEKTKETIDTKKAEPETKDKKEKKGKETKKPERDDDFKYIVRLSNTDVDGEKNFIYGLTSIKGVGLHVATLIANQTGIDKNKKIGDLSDKEVENIQNAIDNIQNSAPAWMLNHRRDMETGENIHLTGSHIEMRLRDEINIMKKIRSYKGIRHERGLRARGQRTRANNRYGLTLGVSKKSVQKK